MKPKTKIDHYVLDLSSKLKPIDEKIANYGFKKAFTLFGYISRNKIYCGECGHSESIKNSNSKYQVCSSCNVKLTKIKYHSRNNELTSYIHVLDVVDNVQVLRLICLRKKFTIKKGISNSWSEVIQNYITKNWKKSLQKSTFGNIFYYDYFNFHSPLELKTWNNKALLWGIMYPHYKITKELKRNGFHYNKSIEFINPNRLVNGLLNHSKLETLFKAKQYFIFNYDRPNKIITYWKSIKICIRNNYIVKDVQMWFDHLELLEKLNKDIFNAKYICPNDLHAEHNKYIVKKRNLELKEEYEKKKARIFEDNLTHYKLKNWAFDLSFEKDNVKIIPLKKVEEFIQEGKLMGHCLYTNDYHLKEESLIFKALVNNESIETVEVDLSNMKVSQCLGKNNYPSKYNKTIIDIVNKNIKTIKKKYSEFKKSILQD